LQGIGLESYSAPRMKKNLLEHFGDKIIIAEINGCPNIITFIDTASSVLTDFYWKPKRMDTEAEAAASLIKDGKSVVLDKDIYPTSLSMSIVEACAAFIPQSLQLFLKALFVGTTEKEMKVCLLGQALMQATHLPRILLALQLGLGVDMHYSFASRFLIDSLNAHGFCCSYMEVY